MRKTNEYKINEELENLRSPWMYRGEVFENDGKYAGFVYLITNLTNGKKYIGRKNLTRSMTVQRSTRKMKTRVESEWLNYWSSSDELKEDVKTLGKDNFSREILHLCKTKGDLNYLETLEIFRQGALLGDGWYNKWVSCKIHKKSVKLIENP